MYDWTQLSKGMHVYDSTGEKIGSLRGFDTSGGYIDVQKGFLFHKDFYVPVSSVSQTTPEGVFLSLSKDDLSNASYDQPPVGGYGTVTDTVGRVAGQGVAGATTAAAAAAGAAGAAGMAAAQTARTTTDRVVDPNAGIDVKAYEEQLTVGTRQREEGHVHLHKEVETLQQNVPVTTRHEQVTLEHVPVADRDIDPNAIADAFTDKDIDVTLMGEEAVVGKRTRLADEVRLRKEVQEVQEQVTGTVRREHIVVDGDDPNLTKR
jgi:uncharacterized protein (TIGR02271 family)